MERQIIYLNEDNNLERARWYMGGFLTFIATGKDTGGKYALIETIMRKGLEPPGHTHTREDESFYVLEGEMLFTVGGKEKLLKAGDHIYLPKGIPHGFKIQTDTAKYLLQVAPAGLEEMFIEVSRPAEKHELPPPPAGPPSPGFIKLMGELTVKYGIQNLDHTQIKELIYNISIPVIMMLN
ncbi:quercetin 2,3-dioxygenase [Mucilaginibacter sp. AW1-3]